MYLCSVIQQIHDIAAQLQAAYPKDEAEALAWWVAEETTGLTRTQLQIGCKDTTNFSNLQAIIERLLHFEPIQYIFGHTLWCGLDLKVTPATLIPRPETAELIMVIGDRLSVIGEPFRVLDIGTGSGCIAIAIKKAHPEWEVTGIDISAEAIEVAKENAQHNGVEVDFKVADIMADILDFNGTFDVVVSNPPYICEQEKAGMRPNVLDYEPATALFVPDNDPLKFYRQIARLHLGTYLFFEINEAFDVEMKELLQKEGYSDIVLTKDIYDKPRIIEGKMQNNLHK